MAGIARRYKCLALCMLVAVMLLAAGSRAAQPLDRVAAQLAAAGGTRRMTDYAMHIVCASDATVYSTAAALVDIYATYALEAATVLANFYSSTSGFQGSYISMFTHYMLLAPIRMIPFFNGPGAAGPAD